MNTLASGAQAVETIGKWRRHVLTMPNDTFSGNPFELKVDATFTHNRTGSKLKLPGYYAGSNEWKIGFMPSRVGKWTYVTSSADLDLDGLTGSVVATKSGHPGMLKPDVTHAKKWRFTDGPYVVPIGLQFSVMLEEADPANFIAAAEFLANDVKGHLFNFRLSPNDIAFADVEARQFNLPLWDRLEQRMEILTERGLGVSVMLYTDDSGKPSFDGQSRTEALLIRYAVARLAGYPTVWFNTGIDFSEYRSASDAEWIGAQLEALDPYAHPRSSRHGGGSGDHVMQNQTFESIGHRTTDFGSLVDFFENADDVPISIDDNWGEEFSRGSFSPADIRRAFWKVTVAGGLGSHVRDDRKSDFPNANDPDAWFHAKHMATKLESEQWLRLINPFIHRELGSTFGRMVPTPSLVAGSGAYSLADPQRTKLLYLVVGPNDKADSGGGEVTVKLSGVTKDFRATWFDPRTGAEMPREPLKGGEDHIIRPPSEDDWVLLLKHTVQRDVSIAPRPERYPQVR